MGMTWPRIKADAQLEEGVRNGCLLQEHPEPRPCAACVELLARVKSARDRTLAQVQD